MEIFHCSMKNRESGDGLTGHQILIGVGTVWRNVCIHGEKCFSKQQKRYRQIYRFFFNLKAQKGNKE